MNTPRGYIWHEMGLMLTGHLLLKSVCDMFVLRVYLLQRDRSFIYTFANNINLTCSLYNLTPFSAPLSDHVEWGLRHWKF